jgi:hypothetical protein
MPQHQPFGATSNPITRVADATKTRAQATAITSPRNIPVNEPG